MIRSILIFALVLLNGIQAYSQKSLPVDSATGKILYEGQRSVDEKKKKLIMEGMMAWSSAKLPYPPMVFSTISSGKDSLVLKGVTEVPSSNKLNAISFRLILLPGKRSFDFVATDFYFEDINLTLEEWLAKYETSDNPRHQRNYTLITTGLDSHIFLSMNALAEKFKKEDP